MKRNVSILLKDILENIQLAENFVREIDFKTFCADKKLQYAAIRCLEIIGEAAKNIPSEIKESNNDIPWKDMSGMRDKLIHSYFGIDLQVIWITIKEDLPTIKLPIKNIYDELLSGDNLNLFVP